MPYHTLKISGVESLLRMCKRLGSTLIMKLETIRLEQVALAKTSTENVALLNSTPLHQ